MFTRGSVSIENKILGILMNHTKKFVELILIDDKNQVCSAFKRENDEEYCFANKQAKNVWDIINKGLRGCTSKNSTTIPFELGVAIRHEYAKGSNSYCIDLFNGEICGAAIIADNVKIDLVYEKVNCIPKNIPYIKLTKPVKALEAASDEPDVPVRSVQEIMLEKEDISWLYNKKYYVITDDFQAERILQYLDNYNGIIAYDTETTGLKINMFSKVNSKWQKELQKWNEEHPNERIRADRLVGLSFSIEKDVAYYFPVGHRKFKNLYEDKDSEVRKMLVKKIKERYTTGDLKDRQGDMADYIRNTPEDEWTPDIILMERIRDILEKKHIVAHNASFEWKVGWCYEIDTNIKDDTMILHDLLYKFRNTTSNKGEPSNLKYLAKLELGIDQWELSDFFIGYEEEEQVRSKGSKKKKLNVDFSYMDYDGTRIYAPTDSDVTLQLLFKYKKDLLENHRELEYLYNVEVVVACAIGYMEFYGHRIDEERIEEVRDEAKARMTLYESEIRQMAKYSDDLELQHYEVLKKLISDIDQAEKEGNKELIKSLRGKLVEATENLRKAIDANQNHVLNLNSPAQVANLFYKEMGIPFKGEKMSVAEKVITPLLRAKNEDGTDKYPIVHLYAEYKKLSTLLSKYFDNLPYYMYPGGYIFSSYGQISTATGRMSCSKPNAQQYPKEITSIVIPRPNFVMIDSDYSQIEYRVLVALAGEEKLLKLFEDPDNDYHTLMASLMFGVPYASVTREMRKEAKSFNFGIPYGMGFKSLALLLKGRTGPAEIEEAKEKYELYFKDQPKVRRFFENVKEMAAVNKYTKTFWNRYRYYSFTDKDGNISPSKKAAALRQAGNAVIQGCIGGDTLIQTKEYGIVKIKDVVGQRLTIWDGYRWTYGDVVYSGKKRKCIVRFSNGQEIICSPTHKFLVVSHRGNTRFVECEDLLTKENSKNPHRVVINQSYAESDFKCDKELLDIDVDLDNVRNGIPDKIFMDTEVLREFLRKLFNKSGKISGKTTILGFETQYDIDKLCKDVQKALLFFGIRSIYRKHDDRYSIQIEADDNEKFLNEIGFVDENRQEVSKEFKYNKEEYTCEKYLVVESVKITDEYIDMYDVYNTVGGYYVADGVITHNTAADVFKIAMARIFLYIRKNNLFGKLLITNMIHDEVLLEADATCLNIQRILRDIGICMSYKVPGFPPLYIGAGVGPTWAKAKSEMAEIHPHLLEILSKEAENMPIFREDKGTPEEVYKYFDERVYNFRVEKIKNYLLDERNKGHDLHPVIGNLLNLQFNFGHDKEKEGLSDEEFTRLCLKEFIKHFGLNVNPDDYKAMNTHKKDEDEEEMRMYTDGEDIEEFDEFDYDDMDEFELLDESDKLYGVSIHDLIDKFGIFVSKSRKVCGISTKNLSRVQKDNLIDYLEKHVCDPTDEGAMQIVFLNETNILNNTGIWVKDVRVDELEDIIFSKNKKKVG